MEEYMKKRGTMLIVYIPRELDHHFAQQITGAIDQELERGAVKQLVFDFSDTDFMDSSGIGMIMGRNTAFKLQRRHCQRHSCKRQDLADHAAFRDLQTY